MNVEVNIHFYHQKPEPVSRTSVLHGRPLIPRDNRQRHPLHTKTMDQEGLQVSYYHLHTQTMDQEGLEVSYYPLYTQTMDQEGL